PCTDSVAQAFSGLMSVNLGNDGTPHRVGAIIVDTLTGLYAAQAVGVALYARERRGEGQRIEVSLAQCAAAILGHKLAEHVPEGGLERLRAADILADRVNGFDDWLADPHIVATGVRSPSSSPRWDNSRHREHREFRSRSMPRCRRPRASASTEPRSSPKSAST